MNVHDLADCLRAQSGGHTPRWTTRANSLRSNLGQEEGVAFAELVMTRGKTVNLRKHLCSAKTSYNIRRHTFPAGIHDANRPRCPQLRSDNREAIDVSGAAAKGVASAQEFLDLGSNVGVLYCSEPPMTAGFPVVAVRGAES